MSVHQQGEISNPLAGPGEAFSSIKSRIWFCLEDSPCQSIEMTMLQGEHDHHLHALQSPTPLQADDTHHAKVSDCESCDEGDRTPEINKIPERDPLHPGWCGSPEVATVFSPRKKQKLLRRRPNCKFLNYLGTRKPSTSPKTGTKAPLEVESEATVVRANATVRVTSVGSMTSSSHESLPKDEARNHLQKKQKEKKIKPEKRMKSRPELMSEIESEVSRDFPLPTAAFPLTDPVMAKLHLRFSQKKAELVHARVLLREVEQERKRRRLDTGTDFKIHPAAFCT